MRASPYRSPLIPVVVASSERAKKIPAVGDRSWLQNALDTPAKSVK